MVTALLITLSLGQAWGVGTYSGLPRRAQTFGAPSVADAGIPGLNANLLAYYKFDGTYVDATGNGHNGTASFTSFDAGIINLGTFPTQPTSVSIVPASPPSLGSVFSLSFWVQPGAIPESQAYWGDYGVIIGQDSANAIYVYQPGFSGPINVQLWIANGLQISAAVTGGAWAHVAMTSNGTTTTLYINAVSVGTTGTVPTWTFNTMMGSGIYVYRGTLDEVAVYSAVLTPTQVSQLYNGGVGRTYPF